MSDLVTIDESVSRSIAETGYTGWVVYIDGSPVFQEIPKNFQIASTVYGGLEIAPRARDRRIVDWKDLDQTKIHRLEVYGFHEFYTQQPLLRVDREPGAKELRYACLTMQGLAFGPGIVGQARTGIAGWKVGWYNPTIKQYDLWEIKRDSRKRLNPAGSPKYLHPESLACKGHPCWPRPHGFGIAPYVFGLTERDVPQPPV